MIRTPASISAVRISTSTNGPGVEVYGPEVPVLADAPLQDRLPGYVGRDPAWRPGVITPR